MIDTLHTYGIQPGDRIVASLPNGQFLIDLIFAAWYLGANICPLSSRLGASQIPSSIARVDPKLYVNEEGFVLKKGKPSPIFSSLFLYTSGSTGTPKIAVLSKKNLLLNASSALSSLDLQKEDRWLLSLPLFHVSGIGILLRSLLAQARLTFRPEDPEITHLSFVPTQLYRTTPVYKKLRCLLLGGAAISNIPPFLPIYLTYGLTEMGSIVTVRKSPPRIDDYFYLGHPLPNREIKIAPDGEILVRGNCLFQGYWEKGSLSLPLQREGWFATKDLGRYCPKEGLAIIGRKDWQFISGGENIQPEEIEKAIYLHCPQVEEVVVVPMKDPEFGFRPIAYIKMRANIAFDAKRMKAILCDFLPKYKVPVAFHQVEDFPRKGLKIDRESLARKLLFSLV